MARSDTRDYAKSDRQFGSLVAHHEQSETIQNEKGEWINVYGKKTPKAGEQLPETPSYSTVDEAVEAAKKRSDEYHEPEEE
jgi:hypothetical protein